MSQHNSLLNKSLHLLLSACLIFCTSSCGNPSARQQEEIRIGILADLPTPGGRPMVNAAEMAADEINDSGGLKVGDHTYKINLVVEDTRNLPDTAAEAARKLIHQENVLALIGPNISRNAIPVADVAENTGTPMISPGSTNPETTRGKRYVSRAAFVDPDQGRAMATFALDELKIRTAVVLYEESSNSNRLVGRNFQQHFQQMGGSVLHFLSYIRDDHKLTQQLELLRSSNPQAVYMPNHTGQIIMLARTLREAQIHIPILGNDGWSPFKVEGNPHLEGSYFTHHWHINAGISSGEEATFVDRYRRRFQWEPVTMSALTKDSMGLLFQALAACENPNPEELRHAIRNSPPYEGLTGVISFETGGDPIKEPMILHLKKGRIEVIPPPHDKASH